jgi:hypothetical protein
VARPAGGHGCADGGSVREADGEADTVARLAGVDWAWSGMVGGSASGSSTSTFALC